MMSWTVHVPSSFLSLNKKHQKRPPFYAVSFHLGESKNDVSMSITRRFHGDEHLRVMVSHDKIDSLRRPWTSDIAMGHVLLFFFGHTQKTSTNDGFSMAMLDYLRVITILIPHQYTKIRGVRCMTLICSVLLGSFRPWAQQPILDWADRFMPLTPWCFCTKDGACFFSPGQHKICLVICSVTAGCFSLSRLVLDAPSQGARLQYCILHICVNISYIRIMLLLVFR